MHLYKHACQEYEINAQSRHEDVISSIVSLFGILYVQKFHAEFIHVQISAYSWQNSKSLKLSTADKQHFR